MPDYSTTFTADETIKCTQKEFKTLCRSMGIKKPESIDDEEALRATHEESALSIEFYPKVSDLFVYGEQYASLDVIPTKFIKELGKVLKLQGRKFLEFGIAYTCSRTCPGSHGGDTFRITDSGKLVMAERSWPKLQG